MLKGSVVFFTYLITLFYLNKKLSLKKHGWMIVILLSLILIGTCNMEDKDSKCIELIINYRRIGSLFRKCIDSIIPTFILIYVYSIREVIKKLQSLSG